MIFEEHFFKIKALFSLIFFNLNKLAVSLYKISSEFGNTGNVLATNPVSFEILAIILLRSGVGVGVGEGVGVGVGEGVGVGVGEGVGVGVGEGVGVGVGEGVGVGVGVGVRVEENPLASDTNSKTSLLAFFLS
jgi:hypothetical protein